MSVLAPVWLVSALICGALGVWVAANKRVGAAAGFWLGFLFGPFGLIVVALLNPAESAAGNATENSDFGGARDLSNDGYRIWLTSKYEITPNDVLDGYVCGQKLFGSTEEALNWAHNDHEESITAQAEAEERSLQREQENRLRREELWRPIRRALPALIGVGILALLVTVYLYGSSWIAEVSEARTRDALVAQLETDMGEHVVLEGPERFCPFKTANGQHAEIHGYILEWSDDGPLSSTESAVRKSLVSMGFHDADYQFDQSDLEYYRSREAVFVKSSRFAAYYLISSGESTGNDASLCLGKLEAIPLPTRSGSTRSP